jgi:hypothetical protein
MKCGQSVLVDIRQIFHKKDLKKPTLNYVVETSLGMPKEGYE